MKENYSETNNTSEFPCKYWLFSFLIVLMSLSPSEKLIKDFVKNGG